MSTLAHDFITFALENKVLLFGEFKTKAGRLSPYFFNAGLFRDGASLARLGHFYAERLLASDLQFDMLFGPAYKGIPLVASIAIALAEKGHNVPFSFNRKEAKDHGEGGTVVGAPLAGRVLIVDDVISAGTSVRESVQLIASYGASPAGVLIALDRQERGQGSQSAVQEVEAQHHIPVRSIASFSDLHDFLAQSPSWAQFLPEVELYRQRYGTQNHA